MNKEKNNVQPPYYICEDYAVLAGPYYIDNFVQEKMLDNVVNDMKRGNIDYRLTTEIVDIENQKGCVVQAKRTLVWRRGMIMYKGDKND